VADEHQFSAVRLLSRRFSTGRKIRNFYLSHLHLASPLGVLPLEFLVYFLLHKTRVTGSSFGVVFEILRLAVLVEHLLVTDGRTDGRTRGDRIPR